MKKGYVSITDIEPHEDTITFNISSRLPNMRMKCALALFSQLLERFDIDPVMILAFRKEFKTETTTTDVGAIREALRRKDGK